MLSPKTLRTALMTFAVCIPLGAFVYFGSPRDPGTLTVVVAFPFFVVFVVRFFARNREFTQLWTSGMASLLSGAFDEAHERFALASRAGVVSSQRRAGLYQCGMVRVLQGRFEEALAALEKADAGGKLRGMPQFHRVAAYQQAVCLALLGRVQEAERFKAEGDRRSAGSPPSAAGALAEALILARSGRYEAAAQRIDTSARLFDADSGKVQRAGRIIHAFALERMGRDPARVARLLHAAAPLGGPEVAALTAHWPELGGFLGAGVSEAA